MPSKKGQKELVTFAVIFLVVIGGLFFADSNGMIDLEDIFSSVGLGSTTFFDNQQVEGVGNFWVAESRINGYTRYVFSKESMSDADKTANSSIEVEFTPQAPTCEYGLFAETVTFSNISNFFGLLGNNVQTVYSLGSAEITSNVSVGVKKNNQRLSVEGKSFETIDVTVPRDEVLDTSEGIIKVQTEGALIGKGQCPSESGVLLAPFVDQDGVTEWKLVSESSYRNAMQEINSAYNFNIFDPFGSLSNFLSAYNGSLRDISVSKGFIGANITGSASQPSSVVHRLNINDVVGVVTVWVSDDLADSVVVIPPSASPKVVLNLNDSTPIEQEATSLFVDIENVGEGEGSFSVNLSIPSNFSSETTSFSTPVLRSGEVYSKKVTIQALRIGSGEICADVTTIGGFTRENDDHCVHFDVNPNRSNDFIRDEQGNIPLPPEDTDLSIGEEQINSDNDSLNDPENTQADEVKCLSNEKLVVESSPVLFAGLIATGQFHTETKCVPEFDILPLLLILVAGLITVIIILMIRTTNKKKKRRR